MKIYQANARVYHYWRDAYHGGKIIHIKYFSTKEKAEHWFEQFAGKWFNYDDKLVPVEDDYQMPDFDIAEIEVE